MFVFLGVHFTAFGVLEHFMNAVSVCTAQTQRLSCVLFTFCIMSLHFHWSKQWYELFTSCNVFCMQAWDFRKFQIRAIISSKHTQQRIWKKLAHCKVLFVAVRMVTRHTLILNCECSSETAPTCDEFQPFIIAVYLLWDNFLISEMTTIHVNNTTKKTPCQPQSEHTSTVAWFQASNAV